MNTINSAQIVRLFVDLSNGKKKLLPLVAPLNRWLKSSVAIGYGHGSMEIVFITAGWKTDVDRVGKPMVMAFVNHRQWCSL